MSTRNNANNETLRKLHRIHQQLTDLRERLDRGPKQIHVREANVKHQEETLAHLQAEAKAHRVATDSKQLHLKSKEDKVKELKVKLNTVGSNREYQALKDQIAADEMANSVLADEILEAFDKLESFAAKIKEATAVVAKAKDDCAKCQREVAEKEPGIRTEVERLEAELKESESALPEEIRDAYQRGVRQRGEEAMAPVLEGFVCGGCNQQVPLNHYNALTLGAAVFCKSCGRLLYLPE